MQRRKDYLEEHGIRQYSCNLESPFAGRVICGKWGKAYGKKVWNINGVDGPRYVWQCTERYRVKGVIGCDSEHVDDKEIKQAFVVAYNRRIENKDMLQTNHEGLTKNNVLNRFRG